MNRTVVLIASAIALVSLAIFVASEETDASSATVYGSSDVGASRIYFDTAGGTGGYTQYVFPGNTIYLPTEYKASGNSNGTYTQISKEGYVLSGWSDGSKTYYPGQSYTVTGSATLTAQWTDLTYDCIGKISGNSKDMNIEAWRTVVHAGTYPGLSLDEAGSYPLMVSSVDRSRLKYTLTVTHNGTQISSTATSTNTSISADWLTLGISNKGEFSFSGSPSEAGIYEIHVNMLTNLDDLDCRWYVSVYDDNDPSIIRHVTYNGTSIAYGPYMTTVKLPDRDTAVRYQNGWTIDVDGSKAVFPVGGSYSLVQKEMKMTASTYSYDEVKASGIVGVIAYNANGGTYNGSFAEIVPSDGYAGLKNGNLVSKEGYTFIGWNPTGDPSKCIYPAGYLYDMGGDYTELKAVWVASPGDPATIYLKNTSDGELNSSFAAYKGYVYALPVHVTEPSGYTFKGWSATQYGVGKGTVDAPDTGKVTGNATFYTVYEEIIYTFSITYKANNGTGSELTSGTATSNCVPYDLEINGPSFVYDGYVFVGWAESEVADSPSFSNGDSYHFTASGNAVLYAVWAEKTAPPLFYVSFNGNGTGVSNVPASTYRTVNSKEVRFTLPSYSPMRDGFDFSGWSEDPNAVAGEYRPGDTITLTLSDGQERRIMCLYAVWTARSSGSDGTDVTVTFQAGGNVVNVVTVPSGSVITEFSAGTVEGRAFVGWFDGEIQWDFSDPVVDSMVLKAKYRQIFHLEIDGTSVSVVLDCVSSSTKVRFSGGSSALTYSSSVIPAFKVPENSSGTVYVTVTTEDGEYGAYRTYSVGSSSGGTTDGGGNDASDTSDTGSADKIKDRLGQLSTTERMFIVIVLLLAGILAVRRFI